MTLSTDSNEANTGEITSLSVLAGRLCWTVIGLGILILTAYRIATAGSGWFTSLDAVYAGSVLLMLGGRWVEHRSGTARTLTDQPATAKHFRWYVVVLLLVALGVWVGANLAGNHLLT